MNSFRSVERAIGYEIERQGRALDAGEPLVMETRGWDEAKQATYRMRAKETSDDYRYFPDPDLPPLHVEAAWIDSGPGIAAGAAGGPACAVRGARAVRLRRRGPRGGPGDDRARSTRSRRPARTSGEGGLELRDRRARARREDPGATPAARRVRRRPPTSPRSWRDRRRRRLATGRPGAARTPPRRRHAGRRAPRGRAARADLGRHGAARARRRGHRGEPARGGRLPRGQGRSPGSSSAGDEGDGGAADAARVTQLVRQRLDGRTEWDC